MQAQELDVTVTGGTPDVRAALTADIFTYLQSADYTNVIISGAIPGGNECDSRSLLDLALSSNPGFKESLVTVVVGED